MAPEPKDAAEYQARFAEHNTVSGYGIDTSMHMPCPFCAAPDWLVFRILDTEEAMHRGAVCLECGRGSRALLCRTKDSVSYEFVQTAGPDQPAWMEPKMRDLRPASPKESPAHE